jgi:anti-sigma B factor antagonist
MYLVTGAAELAKETPAEEPDMRLTREKIHGVVVVKPDGEFIDGSNAKAFRAAMAEAYGDDTGVLLNLEGVRWVDSGGCGAILACCKELRERGGDLKLCVVTGPVRSLFQVIQLHRICDIFNTVAEGLAAFDAGAVAY